VTRIVHLNADTVFASLVAFHAAAVVITSGLSAICHGVHQSKQMRTASYEYRGTENHVSCREEACGIGRRTGLGQGQGLLFGDSNRVSWRETECKYRLRTV